MGTKQKSYDVIVVGAGASGMTAAISAAREGAKTALLEHMDQAGKKLLATGNGKCNFTNQAQGMEYYRGQDPAFVLPALKRFGLKETLAFFQEIGIFPAEKRDGYFYPASGQAASVRQALLQELGRLGVDCRYAIGIRHIEKCKESFFFDTKQGAYVSHACVVATGGKAAKKTGSDGSGIHYITGFGHTIIPTVPALVQLKGKQSFLKELAGIRTEAAITLFIDGKEAARDRGELQLTEFGISGIPAFQVSRFGVYALTEGRDVFATVDFAPDKNQDMLLQYLWRKHSDWKETALADALIGLLPKKLIPVLLKEAGLNTAILLGRCSENQLKRLIFQIKKLRVDIIGNKSFDDAQATAGGVDTKEVDPFTMESKLVKGLFFAGEVLDIDGMCGGYNLQWAWSSGWVAGKEGGKL